ncbi:MAG: hypothetical protein RIC55_12060 [Pirellulaceae bacterium]
MSRVDITHALEVCRQAAVVFAEKEKLQSEAAVDLRPALTELVDANAALARTYVGQLTVEGASIPTDGEVRALLRDCAETTQRAAALLIDRLQAGDDESARLYGDQISRLSAIMAELIRGWPWTNVQAIEESWGQYERGQLMSLEAFANELLGAAK